MRLIKTSVENSLALYITQDKETLEVIGYTKDGVLGTDITTLPSKCYDMKFAYATKTELDTYIVAHIQSIIIEERAILFDRYDILTRIEESEGEDKTALETWYNDWNDLPSTITLENMLDWRDNIPTLPEILEV